jgi:hypothetical protein
MKKVSVNTSEIVADIRARMSDQGIMAKYLLSFASLRKVKDQLLRRELITVQELRASPTDKDRAEKRKLNAVQFARDFREHPDDYYLMDKYGLSAGELAEVYRRLIDNRVLTEFEFFTRDVRVPELEDPTALPSSSSSAVSIVDSGSDVWASERRTHDGRELPPDFYRDFSGVEIGKGAEESSDNGSQPDDSRAVRAGGGRTVSTVVELITGDFCPKCQRPKRSMTEAACPFCGVIFSKVRFSPGRGPVSIWDGELTSE